MSADDTITEPTVHLCWNDSAISRAAEVLQAAGLDIMAQDMAAHLPPPPPADKALILSYFEIACDNRPPGFDELADGLLRDLVRVGWMRVPEPVPYCQAEHPKQPYRCQRNSGHDGQHGYGGIFWNGVR